MHLPDTTPRQSVFYDYKIYPYERAPELDGRGQQHKVVIVGAGPIGLATALDLARFGISSLILESERQVSHGSRAIVFTRRSMEILQMIECHQPFVEKGLSWNLGRSYYRGKEVFQMVMPGSDDDRFAPGLNIQQQYIEQYLVEAVENNPLTTLHWGSKVTGIAQKKGTVSLKVDTEDDEYLLGADWVIAADGGRSTIRKLMGLRMEGQAYTGNFVIADIKADFDLPTERLCHFDPEWNPGNNVLVHREPDGIWRLDFRLPEDETPEKALDPAVLHSRINAILKMIGQEVSWELDWATVYSASTKTLPDYVHNRVLFVGDAAHLLPIFGVRGANTGLQDSNNLAWKLAFVLKGWAPAKLLETYSAERVQAAREICEEGGKSTRFMTPPSRGFGLLRDAVLSLALSGSFIKDLLHWRTSRPHDYHHSALNSFADDDQTFSAGPACGEVLKNLKLGEDDFLFDRLGDSFNLIVFGRDQALSVDVQESLKVAGSFEFPVRRILIADRQSAGLQDLADVVIEDHYARMASQYGAVAGSAYLVRPDQHVCARWQGVNATKLEKALTAATQIV